MKVVINTEYGGFNLSHKAFLKLIERGWKVTVYTDDYRIADPNADLVDISGLDFRPIGKESHYIFSDKRTQEEIRCHPDVIAVVEELGEEANGPYSKLKIVEIPDDVAWTIEDYDGKEWIAEVHRTWS